VESLPIEHGGQCPLTFPVQSKWVMERPQERGTRDCVNVDNARGGVVHSRLNFWRRYW